MIRQHLPTAIVATLAATFGVMLLQVTGILAAAISADPAAAGHDTLPIYLDIAAGVFIVIAIYVSGVVTSNTIATVVAGRVREIALLRLIGSSARRERGRIAREGLIVGAVGAFAGAVLGTALAQGLGAVGCATGILRPFEYGYIQPVLSLPLLAVVLVTWLAAWTGSRHVLRVRPVQALGTATESDSAEIAAHRGKHAAALVLLILGAFFVGLGVLAGTVSPFGVLIALVGGVVSFTGIVLGADRVIPPVLRLIGRALGGSAPARLASENALRHPERSTRMTVGLVIGVTLVTTFAVTMQTFRDIIEAAQRNDPQLYQGTAQILDTTTAVFAVLIGFSALIAAIGLVNSLGLGVLQRTRELGLMRALGFDRKQLRAMILLEAAALTATATVIGLVLGFAYGWAGAQSFLTSIRGTPGLVLPGVPWGVVGIIVAVAVVLTLVASVAPARRATRVSPVVALAAE